MDLKELVAAVGQISEEKGIQTRRAFLAVEQALAAAYKKEYRNRSEVIRGSLNPKTGELQFWQVKTVVLPDEVKIMEEGQDQHEGREQNTNNANTTRIGEEKEEVPLGPDGEPLPRYNPDRHIFVEEAREHKPEAKSGDEIEFPLQPIADFGRIAAQTAKQVILQALREAEKESIQAEYSDKEGEIVSGVIQRFERGSVYVDIGRAIGVLFQNESIPGEHYRVGTRMRFLVLAVQEEDRKRPGIILSRSHPNFVKKLFELEVPEIAEHIVEIKQVAREPGSRTKIAVYSHQEGIDPIGAVVGQRGTRVMAVTNELGNEKIDVIEWSDDTDKFVGNSLSPAKVKLVELRDRREAMALVAEDQLSLAIGKSGQNVRLAAKLTGWKIDVRSQSRPDEVQEGGIADIVQHEGHEADANNANPDKEVGEKN
ncbi:MAG: transcription termination factor NusA [Nanoarchaeota archaeon]|nr:transcription termination factor NusA [Nanoarchaeota archaeon]